MHLEYEYIIYYILKYILSLKLNQLLFSEKSIIVRNAQKIGYKIEKKDKFAKELAFIFDMMYI